MTISKEQWRTYTKKEKLYITCKKLHILRVAQFVNRMILRNEPADIIVDITPQEDVDSELNNWHYINSRFEVAILKFQSIIPSNKKKIVISSHFLEFDKGICSYLNKLSNTIKDTDLILLSHAINITNEEADCKVDFPYFTLPYTAGINRYDKHVDIQLPEYEEKTIDEKKYLKLLTQRLELRHKDMGKNYPKALGYELYRYYQAFLDHFQPEMVILWCEFYAAHSILKDICEERKIKVIYMEFGALPGSFAIEENGQMGESLVAINADKFAKQYVSEDELCQAKEVIDFLKDSKLNRRVQPKSNATNEIARKYKPNRPVIVMFGQNDYEAGIKPYSETTKKFHSPVFTGSDDAAIYVGQLAKDNEWNFIYKPHQMMVKVGECLPDNFPESTIWIGDSDINDLIDLADVCITIVSQCSYISLIRNKPVVMLGYTQLKGKGCTYEAFDIDTVNKEIVLALKIGYTSEQKEAFQLHVAQITKYYLFDDLQHVQRIGQPIEKAVDFVYDILKDLPKSNQNKDCNVLFVCIDSFQLKGAIELKKCMNDSVEADLIWAGYNQMNYDVKNIFGTIFTLPYDKEQFRIKIDEIKFKHFYDDIFICDYNGGIIALFNNLSKKKDNIRIHLYDGGKLEFYVKDIANDIVRSSNNEETKRFFGSICEICMYEREMKLWKKNMNCPITIMPKIKKIPKTHETAIIEKTYFIYIESFLFLERYTSNELQIIEMIKNIVGIDNLLISINPYNKINLYEHKGYHTTQDLDIILQEYIKESNCKLYLFSSFMDEHYFFVNQYSNIIYFDMSEFLISNYPITLSNSYGKFRDVIRNLKKGYYPKSEDELKEFIIYEEGKQ